MRLVVGLRPVSDTLDKPDLAHWAEPAGGLGACPEMRCLGWAGFGLGLKLVSHGWVACRAAGPGCWLCLGAGWAELCLGGLLDGQGLFHTHLGLRLGGELAGLGLRPVSGWRTLRRGWACWMTWGQTRAGGQGLASLG